MSVQRTPRVHAGVRRKTLANRASVRVYGLSCAHVHVNANSLSQKHHARNVHVHEPIPVHPYTSRTHAGSQAYTSVYARRTPYASRALTLSPSSSKEKMASKKPLRETMPHTAAFIDAFREAFGAEAINASIRAGMQGQAGAFYASEAGQTIGTPAPDLSAVSVKLSETIVGPMNKPKKERN